MIFRLFKEVQFDASHRLLHDRGKCNRLHGHRWKVEVWMEGIPGERSGMVADFNMVKEVVCRFDHQIILNRDDPMVAAVREFHPVITTQGEPTSENLAALIAGLLREECTRQGLDARITRVRVWESPACYAEVTYESA
ncbi:MAG: 6-carboxytetrahydropterin synthase [Methanolinea sp.]|nr:6-carboxytetrahydropterin synthase [Methanolinea sp.]